MRRVVTIGFGVMLGAAGVAAQDVPAPPAMPPPVIELQQTPPPPPATTPPTQAPAPGRGQGRGAQTPAPTPQMPIPPGAMPGAPMPPPGRGVEAPSSWQNIRVDVTITDSLSADQQQRKSISLMVLDNRSGQVRSSTGSVIGMINVDASPTIRPDGKIYLRLTLEYVPEINPQVAQATGNSSRASFNESLSLIVNDGKPLLASQAADPRSDRKVTVEVTATVQK